MRKFKCIGLKESCTVRWAKRFKIGKTYKLTDIIDDLDMLRLEVIDGLSMWVDLDQFEEVK